MFEVLVVSMALFVIGILAKRLGLALVGLFGCLLVAAALCGIGEIEQLCHDVVAAVGRLR